MNYTLFDAEEGPGGGFPPVDGSLNKTDRLLVYFRSDDIEADLKKIESLGGKTVMARQKYRGRIDSAFSPTPKGIRWALYTGPNQS